MAVDNSSRRRSLTLLAALIAVPLAVSPSAIAQNAAAPGATEAPPAREANVYDHRDHQPTQADVAGAEGSTFPEESNEQVEKEVDALLKQTDELDKESDERHGSYPNGGR
jgi:hypothetical protein